MKPTTVLIIVGILTVIALAVGIYRLANRDKREANILRTRNKVKRRENFSTTIFVILSILGLIALIFVFTII